MKKIVIFASLSVISSSLLGMQNNILQDNNTQQNNKKHVRFGKDNIILIDSNRYNVNAAKQLTLIQSPISIDKQFIADVCSRKKDINSLDENKNSALVLACNYCLDHEADYLIGQGIDVNLANNDGHIALMYVAMNGNFQLLKRILERKAVVTIQDGRGNTPLLWALKSHIIQDEELRLKIVKALINKDPNTIDQVNLRGETALSIAKNKGLTEIEELLRTTIEIKDDFLNKYVVESEFAEDITEKEENSEPLKESSPYIYDPKFRWGDDVVEDTESVKDENCESADSDKPQSLTDTRVQSKPLGNYVLHKYLEKTISQKNSTNDTEEILELLVSKDKNDTEGLNNETPNANSIDQEEKTTPKKEESLMEIIDFLKAELEKKDYYIHYLKDELKKKDYHFTLYQQNMRNFDGYPMHQQALQQQMFISNDSYDDAPIEIDENYNYCYYYESEDLGKLPHIDSSNETKDSTEKDESSAESTKEKTEENESLVCEQSSENESGNIDKQKDWSEGMTVLLKILDSSKEQLATEFSENLRRRRYSYPDLIRLSEIHSEKNGQEKKTAKTTNSAKTVNSRKLQLREAIESNDLKTANSLIRKHSKLINAEIDKDGNTPLHIAVKNNLEKLMQSLISRGADFEKKNNDGDTPLLIAVKNKSTSFINMLISHGADLNVQDANGDTPLHLAVKDKDHNLADKLTKKGADKEKKNKAGDTPLLVAVKNENSSFVSMLTSYGADLNVQDANEDTPLLWALKSPTIQDESLRLKIVKTIVNNEPNTIDQFNLQGETALSIAKVRGLTKIIKLLENNEQKKQDFSKKYKETAKASSLGNTITELVEEKVSEKLKPNQNVEETALSPESAEESDKITKIVSVENQKLREEKKTFVFEQLSENESGDIDKPEDLSEEMNVSPKILEIWPSKINSDNQLLYDENDADQRESTEINQNSSDSVEAIDSQQIQFREDTKLHSIEWVKQRIDEGLINDVVDESGNTLLHIAVTDNNIEIIKLLLKNKADLNIKNETGMTALHIAVVNENLSTVNLLLEHKAKPNLGNQSGTSPLMLAANIGSINILKTLIKHGAQVDATNHDKNNALMISLLSNNCNLSVKYNIAVILINADLSIINQVNKDGETAQSIAKSRKFENINKLMIEAGRKLEKINNQKKKKQVNNIEKTEPMSAKPIIEKSEKLKSKNSTIELTDNHKKENVVVQTSETNDRTSEVSKETTKIKELHASTDDLSVENMQAKKTETSMDFKLFWKNLIDKYKRFFDPADKDGNTPMQRAKKKEESKLQAQLKEAIQSNDIKSVIELLKVDKRLLNTPIDERGNTPLLLALEKKHEDVIYMIMNYDDEIDFTHQNKDGKTAFILAAENEDIYTLDMIIDGKRPGANISDKDGNTPLILMLKSNDYFIAKTMTCRLFAYYSDIDVNHRNNNKETALIIALRQNRLEIAALLLKNPDLRLNITDENGNTQLSLAMDIFQKTLKTQYSENNDNLINRSLNILAELKKGNIEEANKLIIANIKYLKIERGSDLEILNSFRNALMPE